MKECVARGSCMTPELRRDFWQDFKRYLGESNSLHCSRVTTDGWMWHDANLTAGNLLSMLRVRLREIGVKYTLNGADANTVFAFLLDHRKSIDVVFEVAPQWRTGGDGSNVIEVRRAVASYERQVWPDQFRWLQRQLETFRLALSPLIGRVPPKGETRQWDEDAFVREVRAWNPAAIGPAKEILSWSSAHGAAVVWGRGRRCGSFCPTITHGGFPYQLVSVRTDGAFALLFTQLRKSPLFGEKARRLELLRHLNEVRYFALPDAVVDFRQSLPLAMLADHAACAQFVDALDWFRERVSSD